MMSHVSHDIMVSHGVPVAVKKIRLPTMPNVSQCHILVSMPLHPSLSLSLPYPILSPVLDLTAPSSVPLSPRSQSRGYPGQGVRICPGHVKLNGMCRSSWDADCSQSGQTNFGSAQWHAGIMFRQVSVTESLSGNQSCIVRLGNIKLY